MVYCYLGFNGLTCWFTRIVNIFENAYIIWVCKTLSKCNIFSDASWWPWSLSISLVYQRDHKDDNKPHPRSLSISSVYWRDCEDKTQDVSRYFVYTKSFKSPLLYLSINDNITSQCHPAYLKSIGWCSNHLSLISILFDTSCGPGYNVFHDLAFGWCFNFHLGSFILARHQCADETLQTLNLISLLINSIVV